MKHIAYMSAIMVASAIAAFAAGPFTTTVTVPNTGSGTYTVTRDYSSEQLISIEAFQGGASGATVTVTRVRGSAPARTNTVASIVLSSGAGLYVQNYLTNLFLFKGDILKFAVSPVTNVNVEITGLVSP